MAKEFFVSEWLKNHFTTYIISHEILLIPLYFYLFSFSNFQFSDVKNIDFWFLTGFLFTSFFILEITRKFRSKKQEIASKDTYTAQYGIKGASFIVFILASLTLLFQVFLTKNIFPKFHQDLILSGIFLIILSYFLQKFARNSTQKNAKKVFGISILFFIAINMIFISTLLI
jgi:4-hydroxybenzoate polyprenyltransferase